MNKIKQMLAIVAGTLLLTTTTGLRAELSDSRSATELGYYSSWQQDRKVFHHYRHGYFRGHRIRSRYRHGHNFWHVGFYHWGHRGGHYRRYSWHPHWRGQAFIWPGFYQTYRYPYRHAYWKRARNGYIPRFSVVKGYSSGTPYYHCKAYHRNNYYHGRIFRGNRCLIYTGGKSRSADNYLVLVNT